MKPILLFILMLISSSVFSCSCAPKLNVKTSFKQSDIVLSVKVIGITEPKTDTIYFKDGTMEFISFSNDRIK